MGHFVTSCDNSGFDPGHLCDISRVPLLDQGLISRMGGDSAGCQNILNSRAFIWGLLALPSIPMVLALANGAVSEDGRPATEFLLHPTGEFAARFMIISMIISPFRLLFPKNAFWYWMLRRRRYFGVAAFLYAVLHTVLYIVDMGSWQSILGEFWALGIWTGWLAFFVFLPMAVTSNDASVRRLGRYWKPLQRLVTWPPWQRFFTGCSYTTNSVRLWCISCRWLSLRATGSTDLPVLQSRSQTGCCLNGTPDFERTKR